MSPQFVIKATSEKTNDIAYLDKAVGSIIRRLPDENIYIGNFLEVATRIKEERLFDIANRRISASAWNYESVPYIEVIEDLQ